jgi:hemerythrin-like domain-containing protein/histidinol phosphatase-like enzyme
MTDTSTSIAPNIKVIFFDARDTLGEVDRPGHLLPYRPSTEKLLSAMKNVGMRMGVITNLPKEISAEQGRKMVRDAVLSETPMLTIGDFIPESHVVTNHDAGSDKPSPDVYRFAAKRLEVAPEECLFVGENLIEVLGARAAGMQAQLKPSPPGREFMAAPINGTKSATDSGRAFESFFEHEHLLGERIFKSADKIAEGLRALKRGADLPGNLRTGMGFLVYLLDNFADQVHLRAEEAVIPIAVARGMDPKHGQWVFDQHDQARAYFRALDIAWKRVENGDEDDRWHAIGDFYRISESFVLLFKDHAVRENDHFYPEVGSYFSESDDALVLNIISHFGPPDITPYVALVEAMERALGLAS